MTCWPLKAGLACESKVNEFSAHSPLAAFTAPGGRPELLAEKRVAPVEGPVGIRVRP